MSKSDEELEGLSNPPDDRFLSLEDGRETSTDNRLQLLAKGRTLGLFRPRTQKCYTEALYTKDGRQQVELDVSWHDNGDGLGDVSNTRIRGLKRCDSRTGCPWCTHLSATIQATRVNTWAYHHLGETTDATPGGPQMLLWTATLPHRVHERLDDVHDRLKGAFKLFNSRRGAILKDPNITTWLRGYEVTRSSLHGWHPHYHFLILLDKDPGGMQWEPLRKRRGQMVYKPDHISKRYASGERGTPILRFYELLQTAWIEAVEQFTPHRFREDHMWAAADLRSVSSLIGGIGGYFKSCGFEITHAGRKRGKSRVVNGREVYHRTAWELLADACEYEDTQDMEHWKEYIEHMRYKQLLGYPRGDRNPKNIWEGVEPVPLEGDEPAEEPDWAAWRILPDSFWWTLSRMWVGQQSGPTWLRKILRGEYLPDETRKDPETIAAEWYRVGELIDWLMDLYQPVTYRQWKTTIDDWIWWVKSGRWSPYYAHNNQDIAEDDIPY